MHLTLRSLARPSRESAGTLVAALALSIFGCGGNQAEDDPPPVCYASHPVPDSGMVRNLRPAEWATLVLGSYSPGQRSSADCVGNAIQWRATDRQCDVHEPDDEPRPEATALEEESVIVGRGDSPMRRPVWVITHRFNNGDGFGPVVVTNRDERGVGVTAIGSLRMPTERARLRIRETGGRQIVVADGQHCEAPDDDDDDASSSDDDGEEEEEEVCQRYARVMPVVGDRVMTAEVRNGERHCIGPAQVWLERHETSALENGWERSFNLAASMEYRGGAIIIHEQVTVEDSDPRDPGRPARLFRTTDADRVIRLQTRGGMTSDGLPLFERAMRAEGSLQLPIAESNRDEE